MRLLSSAWRHELAKITENTFHSFERGECSLFPVCSRTLTIGNSR